MEYSRTWTFSGSINSPTYSPVEVNWRTSFDTLYPSVVYRCLSLVILMQWLRRSLLNPKKFAESLVVVLGYEAFVWIRSRNWEEYAWCMSPVSFRSIINGDWQEFISNGRTLQVLIDALHLIRQGHFPRLQDMAAHWSSPFFPPQFYPFLQALLQATAYMESPRICAGQADEPEETLQDVIRVIQSGRRDNEVRWQFNDLLALQRENVLLNEKHSQLAYGSYHEIGDFMHLGLQATLQMSRVYQHFPSQPDRALPISQGGSRPGFSYGHLSSDNHLFGHMHTLFNFTDEDSHQHSVEHHVQPSHGESTPGTDIGPDQSLHADMAPFKYTSTQPENIVWPGGNYRPPQSLGHMRALNTILFSSSSQQPPMIIGHLQRSSDGIYERDMEPSPRTSSHQTANAPGSRGPQQQLFGPWVNLSNSSQQSPVIADQLQRPSEGIEPNLETSRTCSRQPPNASAAIRYLEQDLGSTRAINVMNLSTTSQQPPMVFTSQPPDVAAIPVHFERDAIGPDTRRSSRGRDRSLRRKFPREIPPRLQAWRRMSPQRAACDSDQLNF